MSADLFYSKCLQFWISKSREKRARQKREDVFSSKKDAKRKKREGTRTHCAWATSCLKTMSLLVCVCVRMKMRRSEFFSKKGVPCKSAKIRKKKNPGTLNMKHEKKKREKQQIHTPGGRERERAMSSPKALLLCRACAPRADLSSSSSSPSSSSTSSRSSSTLTKSSGRRAALIFPTLSFLTTTAAPSSLAEEEGANSSNNNKNNNNNNSIVTSYAYFDIGTCESIVRAERALGGDAVCSKEDAEMLGRVKIGLFGDGSARDTVSMFKKLVESGAYDRTVFHDVRKGEFVAFGLNGSKRLGNMY